VDWSKATNILIALFIAVDLALGGLYFSREYRQAQAEAEAARATQSYLEERGAFVRCSMPQGKRRMAVLFVSIVKDDGSEEDSRFDGLRVVLTGSPGYKAEGINYGDARAGTLSASGALQKFVAMHADDDVLTELKIYEIELVYWVNREDLQGGEGTDTARPAWRLRTSRGEYFIEAF
jgi:hypothetical protein